MHKWICLVRPPVLDDPRYPYFTYVMGSSVKDDDHVKPRGYELELEAGERFDKTTRFDGR